MPDVGLALLLEATEPTRLAQAFEPFFRQNGEVPVVETTRLHPPRWYWVVYRHGDQRVTLKSFFRGDDYAEYCEELKEFYPDRLGQPEHPQGGLILAPELNAILWGFPFDPAMPALARCLDGGWIARDRKSTRLNSSHIQKSRMPSSA